MVHLLHKMKICFSLCSRPNFTTLHSLLSKAVEACEMQRWSGPPFLSLPFSPCISGQCLMHLPFLTLPPTPVPKSPTLYFPIKLSLVFQVCYFFFPVLIFLFSLLFCFLGRYLPTQLSLIQLGYSSTRDQERTRSHQSDCSDHRKVSMMETCGIIWRYLLMIGGKYYIFQVDLKHLTKHPTIHSSVSKYQQC